MYLVDKGTELVFLVTKSCPFVEEVFVQELSIHGINPQPELCSDSYIGWCVSALVEHLQSLRVDTVPTFALFFG